MHDHLAPHCIHGKIALRRFPDVTVLLAFLLTLAEPNAVESCPLPRLDFSSATTLSEEDRARFTDNFRIALEKACAERLFADGLLTDERSYDRSVLYVVSANEANVSSIYFAPSGAPPTTMMEVPFGDPPQIPSVDELHETIYCWAKGATEVEQEESGRCLPD